MKKGLLIVESPTKVRTIKRYIGEGYDVRASVGHVIDLPPRRFGVDIERDFTPEYEVIRGKAKVIKDLKEASEKVSHIYLATDPDREGEAIAWHIVQALKENNLKGKSFHRVLFHELTGRAIKEAVLHPVELDQKKFESQQARRILDRIVGYQVSPLLWEKVKKGLSAGRVQSVAVRIICEREREIQAFVSEEFWTIDAELKNEPHASFLARLSKYKGKKLSVSNEEQARDLVTDLKDQEFTVKKVLKKERKRNAPPPFITSTLQQDASRKLGFSAKKTMTVAQKLYEGIELGKEGPVGLITYMRTDSTRVAKEAQNEARAFIQEKYGKEFLPSRPPQFKKGRHAQEAHEAIRPTSISRIPESLTSFLGKDEISLYELIWKRFLASQMSPAVYDQTQVKIGAGPYILQVTGSVMRFLGFIILYSGEKGEEEVEGEGVEAKKLPPLSEGDSLALVSVIPKQHFTQPPPRYTEATLIKALEENGIGRPSTYAAILSTIREKGYVNLSRRYLHSSELGFVVNDLLVANFPGIINTSFTAEMEKGLDDVEEGVRNSKELLKDFYVPFKQSLDKAKVEMESIRKKGVPTEILCEKCGSPMVIRYGSYGEFLACSGFPKCKNTKDFVRDDTGKIVVKEKEPQLTSEVCEKCGKPMEIKKSRYGTFLACSGYPKCKNTKPMPSPFPCPIPDCGGKLYKKRSKKGRFFWGCNRYPECNFATWDEPVKQRCPMCNAPVMLLKKGKGGEKRLVCPNKECGYILEEKKG